MKRINQMQFDIRRQTVLLIFLSIFLAPAFGGELKDDNTALLTPQQTLGAAFIRPGEEAGPPWNFYRRSSPEAKDGVYRVLQNDDLREFHSAAIRILGYMGNSNDADYLESFILDEYEGVLDRDARNAVHAAFEALGIMHGRDVNGSGDILGRMLEPEYWEQVDFRWRSKDITAGPGFAYESIAWALHGYAMSEMVDLSEKAKGVLNQIDDPGLRRYMEWRIEPERLKRSAERIRRAADQPVTARQRKDAAKHFNGDFQNPGPAEAIMTEEDHVSPPPWPVENLREAAFEGETEVNEGEVAVVKELLKEARHEYKSIAVTIVNEEYEEYSELWGRLLNNAEIIDPEWAARRSDRFEESVGITRNILKEVAGAEVEWVPLQIHRDLDYQPVREAEGEFRIVKREVTTVKWMLEGTAPIVREHIPSGSPTVTVHEGRNLVVFMKLVDGKWYWNPFGW